MPRSLLWPDPRVKPPFGAAEIDWGHPLTDKLLALLLLNENGGPFRDLVRPRQTVFGTAPFWQPNAEGIGVQYPGTATASSFTIDLSGFSKISLEMIFSWNSFANDDKLAAEYTADANNVNAFLIDPNSGAPDLGLFQVNVSSSSSTNNGGGFARPSAGTAHRYLFTLDRTVPGGTLATGAYVDGIAQTITAHATSAPVGNFVNSTLYLFARNQTSLLGVGNLTKLAIYNQILSSAEAFRLSAEPYASLRPIVRRRYFVPSADIINPYNPWLHRGPVLAQ